MGWMGYGVLSVVAMGVGGWLGWHELPYAWHGCLFFLGVGLLIGGLGGLFIVCFERKYYS